MQKKSNEKNKEYNLNSLENDIDFIIPIDEVEINGMVVSISKLDDYKERIYNTNKTVQSLNTEVEAINLNDLDLNNIELDNVPLNHQSSNGYRTEGILEGSRDMDALQQNKESKKEKSNLSTSISKMSKNKKNNESKTVDKRNTDSKKENLKSNTSNSKLDNGLTSNKKKKKAKTALLVTLIAATGVAGCDIYTKYKAEQLRLSEYDKENLDLKLVIDTVDSYGGDESQLNWQEVAAVLGVIVKNRPNEITKENINYTCSLFLDKESNRVKDFRTVLDNLELSEKEKERAYNYLLDLENHGYMPERLIQDSPQMKFINSIKDGAIKSYKETKILPSITIAQAILESNWGQSNLAKESNNLFGIKADSSWKGEYVTFETKEYHSQMIKDKFRKYANIEDSILDHSKFLRENERYTEGGVFEAKTYKKQALALQESGYSTAEDENGNKTYALMLEQIIRQYNLQVLDSNVIRDSR